MVRVWRVGNKLVWSEGGTSGVISKVISGRGGCLGDEIGEGGAEGFGSAWVWCLLDKSLGQMVVKLGKVWEEEAGKDIAGIKLFLNSCNCIPHSKMRSMVCMSILR